MSRVGKTPVKPYHNLIKTLVKPYEHFIRTLLRPNSTPHQKLIKVLLFFATNLIRILSKPHFNRVSIWVPEGSLAVFFGVRF